MGKFTMGGNAGHQTGHGLGDEAIGHVSANWHASIPTYQADQNFTPNFRQFDTMLNTCDTPDEDLTNRLYRSNEGEERYDLHTYYGARPRAAPVVLTSLGGGFMVNFMYTRLWGKTGVSMRWSFLKCYTAILLWNNFSKWAGRERNFQKDFKRNQAYGQDEMRYMRDQQRVRETLYLKQFVNNPIAEYRVKAWQVADRFA